MIKVWLVSDSEWILTLYIFRNSFALFAEGYGLSRNVHTHTNYGIKFWKHSLIPRSGFKPTYSVLEWWISWVTRCRDWTKCSFFCNITLLKPNDIYSGCHRRNGPNFGRVFLMLNYTDITQNTYVPSWTVIEIMAK